MPSTRPQNHALKKSVSKTATLKNPKTGHIIKTTRAKVAGKITRNTAANDEAVTNEPAAFSERDTIAQSVITAKDAKNNFGALMDDVRRAPIVITKHGRASVAIMDIELFEYLADFMEDYYDTKELAKRPRSKDDYLGAEETEKFLKELVDAAD